MKTIALSFLSIALTACAASTTQSPPTNAATNTTTPTQIYKENAAKNCICVKMWMPVCGANHKTYGNSCEADCAGVKYKQGACAEKK